MSAYFESLNRRVSTLPTASVAAAPVIVPDPVVVPEPARVPLQRLAPGAVPAAYATLRERLMMTSNGKALKALVFAGCEGGEGCTQVVREFSESLASAGLNVLLADVDMRTGGLTTSLAARADLTALVRAKEVPPATRWGRGQLTVAPSPAGMVDKESFLRSPDFALWLDKQRLTFDYTF